MPSSDAIFGAVVYTNGVLAQSPKTDADWARLASHADALVTAAGTIERLAPADNPGAWTTQAAAMGDAARQAGRAIEARDLERVLEAGSRIYDACTRCHATYTSLE